MNPWMEELDYQKTPMGELILQRRRVAALDGAEAYEVRLGGAYLMSSLFHAAEVELADRCLGLLGQGDWEVVVGGLGLGYTAAATLKFPQMKRLIVVEALQPVITWHQKGLVPNGRALSDDPRCVYRHADFFALARENGFDPDLEDRRFDAILLDIDHTPNQLLSSAHADFYSEAGQRRLKRFLKPGGVFGLWSNEPPEEAFLRIMTRVFGQAEGQLIRFDNPIQNITCSNGIYIARTVA